MLSGTTDVQAILEGILIIIILMTIRLFALFHTLGDSVDSGFMKETTRISQETIRDVSEDILAYAKFFDILFNVLTIRYNEKVSKYLQSLKIKVTPVLKAETLESLLEKNLTHENSAFYLVNISAVIGMASCRFLASRPNSVEKYLEHKLFLPRAVPHYAIKSNPDFAIVHTLHLLGCGFDCASMVCGLRES